MAQNKSLNAAIDELLKDYKKALTEAVEYASNRAVEDIWKYSLNCLEEYYANYSPTSYDRTDQLWHAFVPYLEIENEKDKIITTVGVEYDASRLTTYKVGSKDYGKRDVDQGKSIIPLNEWILNNYLAGIHPATDGSRNVGEAFYYENIDPVSPTQKMYAYLGEYGKTTFKENLLISFAKQVKKIMRR